MSTRFLPVHPLVWSVAQLLFLGSACAGTGGCAWDNWFKPPQAPPPPADGLILRAGSLQPEAPPDEHTPAGELAGAREVYREGNYDKAELLFHNIADNTKNPAAIAEEARFYEAECLRRQGKYPKSVDVYHKMLTDFPSGTYREQALQHMFDIANYWLDDTRREMDAERQKRDGKRWVVWPHFVNWEKSKPLLDEEGRAMEALEQVRYNDMTGPLADKALFLAGSVKFFNQDYKDAEVYFSQLVEMHKDSPLAPQAVELAIIAKNLSTGGSDYDGRKAAEARIMVDTAFRNYPEFVGNKDKSEFLNRQLIGITLQQAEKDYKVAEFYRRTGHPGPAYFYYEIVRRRYPGTKYHELATERMTELRAKHEKELAAPKATSAPRPPTTPGLGSAPDFQAVVPGAPLLSPDPAPETAPQPRKLPALDR